MVINSEMPGHMSCCLHGGCSEIIYQNSSGHSIREMSFVIIVQPSRRYIESRPGIRRRTRLLDSSVRDGPLQPQIPAARADGYARGTRRDLPAL